MNSEKSELARKIVAEAALKGVTVSLAESCTGGLVAASLTDISGSSKIFRGSAVTYSNEAKRDILGIDAQIIEEYGAVSSQCAEKMAEGSRKAFVSDIALSITGIAGPDGGSKDKPVGTVWFGISEENETFSFKKKFIGDRAEIRGLALNQALVSLLERIRQK